MPANEPKPGGEIVLYQTEDGRTRLQVRLDDETVWLTQAQMAELFQTTIPKVSMHIRNVYAYVFIEEGSSFVPDGLVSLSRHHPAINRWAIFSRPCGTWVHGAC